MACLETMSPSWVEGYQETWPKSDCAACVLSHPLLHCVFLGLLLIFIHNPFFKLHIEGSYRKHLYFTTVHHRTVWPLEVLKDLKRMGSDSPGPGSCRSRSRTLCRDPSSENLFVDLGAQPRCPQSVPRTIPSWQMQKDKASGMKWVLPLRFTFC